MSRVASCRVGLVGTICLLLFGCTSTPTIVPSAAPTSAATGAETSTAATPGSDDSSASPTAAQSTPASPMPSGTGSPARPDVDAVLNMDYLAGCGWDMPAAKIRVRSGRQVTKTPERDGVRSTARVTDRRLVTLAGQLYGLVEFTCDVGQDGFVGYHLVGWRDSEPLDLGLIAANGGKISIKARDSDIRVSYSYQTSYDSNAERSGHASYRVVVAGWTPVRLYGDEKASDVESAVSQLQPGQWMAGMVAVSGYVYEESQTTWTIGLLTRANRVLLPWALGAPQSECWIPTVHTQAAENTAYRSMSFTDGPGDLSGTVMTLAKRSAAPLGSAQSTSTPVKRKRAGLLVEPQGRVPALAEAQPERTEFDTSGTETVVFSGAPIDELLFSYWFEVNQDPDQLRGPSAALLSFTGEVLMMGNWSPVPFSEGQVAGYGMVGMPDPQDSHALTC